MISAKDIKPAGGPVRPQSPLPSPEITVAEERRAEELQTGPWAPQAPVNTQHPPSRPGGPGCRRWLGSDSAFWDRPGLGRQREELEGAPGSRDGGRAWPCLPALDTHRECEYSSARSAACSLQSSAVLTSLFQSPTQRRS